MTPAEQAPPELSPGQERRLLEQGVVEVKGRVLPASNLTFFVEVASGDRSMECVYKPVRGERPLWDFPDGTLAAREVAAYTVSESLGWHVVPLTVLREGPFGQGMLQAWRNPDESQNPVDLVPSGKVTSGYLPVLDAVDADGSAVTLVHEDTAPLRRMAVFDVLINNADRKGGHVLAMRSGHRYGVDHGVSFHVDEKLRTVLWGWAESPLDPSDIDDLRALRKNLATPERQPYRALMRLLDGSEIDAFVGRLDALLEAGRMPVPSGEWPSIPWPAF